MVELIFAIVVIAVAIGSLPAILNQSSRAIEQSINQEVVWLASEKLYNSLTADSKAKLSSINGEVTTVALEGKDGYKREYSVKLEVKNYYLDEVPHTGSSEVILEIEQDPSSDDFKLLEVTITNSDKEIVKLFGFTLLFLED